MLKVVRFIILLSLLFSLDVFSGLTGNSSTTKEQSGPSLLEQILEYRDSLDLPEVKTHPVLNQMAKNYINKMAKNDRLDAHAGFDKRLQKWSEISYGMNGCVENIAKNFGYKQPQTSCMRQWISSTGHEKNLSVNWSENQIGYIGVAEKISKTKRHYFVMLICYADGLIVKK